MKKISLIIVAFILFSGFVFIGKDDTARTTNELVWYTDLANAAEASKATNKPLFALFTGSDWCGWCKKLQKEVFAKPAFIEWAEENVVLVELDFPRTKELSPELTQQNANLKQLFQVQAFPTIWVFNMNKEADGKFTIEKIGSLGYPGGAEPGKEEVKFLIDANTVLGKTAGK